MTETACVESIPATVVVAERSWTVTFHRRDGRVVGWSFARATKDAPHAIQRAIREEARARAREIEGRVA